MGRDSRSPVKKERHSPRRDERERGRDRDRERGRDDRDGRKKRGYENDEQRTKAEERAERDARSRSRQRQLKAAKIEEGVKQEPGAEPTEPKLDPVGALAGQYGDAKKDVWGKLGAELDEDGMPKKVEEPNFEASGLLAAESNSKNGVNLKFTVPPEARAPTDKWRLYVFKDGEQLKVQHLHRATHFLFGKDRRVVDVPTDHETCSKQHAVLTFRLKPNGREVAPYILDLESTNGPFLNGERLEAARYVECRAQDVLKFGKSAREFVLMNVGAAGKVELTAEQIADL